MRLTPSLWSLFSLVIWAGVALAQQATDRYQADHQRRIDADRPASFSIDYDPDGRYRQPRALCWVDSQHALVSTQNGGDVFQFDWSDRSLSIAFHQPAAQWGDLELIGDREVAVADTHGDQVMLWKRRGGLWRPGRRFDVPGQPSRILWDAQTSTLYVSSVWSRRLYRWRNSASIVQEDSESNWIPLPPIDLPMPGGEMVLLPDQGAVMVADAFGRNFAIYDTDTAKPINQGQLYGHNVCGFARVRDGKYVVFPNQLLNEFMNSVRDQITWGGVLSSNLRWLKIERLLTCTGEEIFQQGHFYPLGGSGDGAGDPTSLQIAPDGRIAVTLGGTNRVAIGYEGDHYFQQIDVGWRPVDCRFSPDHTVLIVVNQFSDSLSMVDLKSNEVQHVALGPVRPPTQAERGERLFYDATLSHDNWMSCHSCHSDGHTNGQLNDNFTDDSFGTPKRILSLLGRAGTQPYGWGGQLMTLEDQVTHSIHSTMASDYQVRSSVAEDIAAFIRTLPAPPSVSEARQEDGQAEQRTVGRRLFGQLGCADCHAGQQLTTDATFDVGFVDEAEMQEFNPPSLMGLSQRQQALFHDGRAGSIRDVLTKFKHQLPRELTGNEVEALLTFLETL